MLKDWHYVLFVLFAGTAPFVHLSSKLGPSPSTTPSCASLLSQSYHPAVGRAATWLYSLLGVGVSSSCRSLNLQLHAANSVLLYVVINQLLSSQRLYSDGMRQQTAALCAIFFAVHPSRTDVTTQTNSIEESLSLSLSLGGLLCLLPVFASKLTHMYAPASVACFTLAALASPKSSAADVPLVIAFVLGFQALKVPAKTGKRVVVGLCLLVPVLASYALETLSAGSAGSSPPTSANNNKGRWGTKAKSRGGGGGGAGQGWEYVRGSLALRVCIGICEVLSRQVCAFSKSALGWERDAVLLNPENSFTLLLFVVALMGCAVHTLWRGLSSSTRPCVACVCFLSFALLCVRGALRAAAVSSQMDESPLRGLFEAASVGRRTYLPACFISIFAAFALVDAWAAGSAPLPAPSPSGRRTSRAAPTAPAMPLLAKCGYSVLGLTSLLYIAHNFSFSQDRLDSAPR